MHHISRAHLKPPKPSLGLMQKNHLIHLHLLFAASHPEAGKTTAELLLSPSCYFSTPTTAKCHKFSYPQQPQCTDRDTVHRPRILAAVNGATSLTSARVGSLTERPVQNTSGLTITIHGLYPLTSRQMRLSAHANIQLQFPQLEILGGAPAWCTPSRVAFCWCIYMCLRLKVSTECRPISIQKSRLGASKKRGTSSQLRDTDFVLE